MATFNVIGQSTCNGYCASIATFGVIGSGSCCGGSSTLIFYTYKYAVGSILYDLQLAQQQGKLEKIVIKKVLLNTDPWGFIVPIYKDTLNAVWNENMLCTESDARAYATIYLENLKQEIQNSLCDCSYLTPLTPAQQWEEEQEEIEAITDRHG